ncbi:hypothetical protein PUNSTDRAFT_93035 [Punctularia strigosozonata HHB-11173 SS5]|uniref:Polynucleotide 5'-hydroxyl-kinase GRC3 n=1 Tax=Punctularia strigosozonata (strain HHB-11173) TaxID=741275 RepID=R7S292_PUNST|nr:uncharacterized protein PUNSTDRAFT_93035 [Punctularia strigosozonata HHB-11173 SS5]EIN04313.1 hypothetical protein PUNSTDRAFT_93035 [Punctularia strigosozonata HHB-11173 SS5]
MEAAEESSVVKVVPSATTRFLDGKRAWSPSRALLDSSDDEEIQDTPIHSAIACYDIPPVSTLRPIRDQNIFHLTPQEVSALGIASPSPATFVLLVPDETLSLIGTYALTILRGAVSLQNVTLRPSLTSHRVFASRLSPISPIRALKMDTVLAVEGLDMCLPRRIKAIVGNRIAVVIQELRTGVENLSKVCRLFSGAFRTSQDESTDDIGLTGIHMITNAARDLHPLRILPSWNVALQDALPHQARHDSVQVMDAVRTPVYLIRGPKKVGKSNFSRTLLNTLLGHYRRAAFLECDLGQSEFTPPGMVSLAIIEQPVFGPAFTHLTVPFRAHYIGSSTARSLPSLYLDAIQALIQSYRLEVQHATFLLDGDVVQGPANGDDGDQLIEDAIPLVVNTMGWSKGMGADLNARIEEMLDPTCIFEFRSPSYPDDISNIQVLPDPYGYSSTIGFLQEGRNRRYILEPAISPLSPAFTNYRPADARTLSLLSYFYGIFSASTNSSGAFLMVSSWNSSLPLCALPPYEVLPSIALDKVVLAGAGFEDVVPTEIVRVLNGALVALVSCEPGAEDSTSDSRVHTGGIPYVQAAPPPSPNLSSCLGLALIRSVQLSSEHTDEKPLQILTPLPPSLLASCRVLVKGEQELPVWGMLDFRSSGGEVAGMDKDNVPYLRWGPSEGAGGEKRRVRRNLMRKGQI